MRSLNVLSIIVIMLLLVSCGSEEIISPQEQLDRDIAEIDAYLQDQNIVAIEDPSGLRYVVTEQGTGRQPTVASEVVTNYQGRFFDGTVFDENSSISFPVSGVIVGWQIMLTKMTEGSSVTVYIPSGLAYGGRGSGSVPPNTNLIFDIDLLEVF